MLHGFVVILGFESNFSGQSQTNPVLIQIVWFSLKNLLYRKTEMKLVNVLLFSEPKNSLESLQLQYLVQQVADNPMRFIENGFIEKVSSPNRCPLFESS